MSQSRYDDLKELFVQVRELPPEHRASFLDMHCANNPSLREELERLLVVDVTDMTQPEGHLAGSADAKDAQLRVVGRYRLLDLLGEGGFGLVYLAEQTEPVRRRVALKVIKPGMDSRAVIARFEVERQALALMDHPNVASAASAVGQLLRSCDFVDAFRRRVSLRLGDKSDAGNPNAVTMESKSHPA